MFVPEQSLEGLCTSGAANSSCVGTEKSQVRLFASGISDADVVGTEQSLMELCTLRTTGDMVDACMFGACINWGSV